MVEIVGEDGAKRLQETFKTFNVKGATLSDGSKGTLALKFMNRDEIKAGKDNLKIDANASEENNKLAGKNYEKVILPYGFLDNFSFTVSIVPETLWQSSQSINMAMEIEKTQLIAKLFPEYFSANKEVLFGNVLKVYHDSPDKYNIEKTMPFEQQKAMELAQGGASSPQGGSGSGITSDLAGVDKNNSLSDIMQQ